MAQSLHLNELKRIDMQDDNWTVHDKLAMYRGLVKIYNREQINQMHDSIVLKKQNYKKISGLKEELKDLRECLVAGAKGGASVIATSLQENKQLHLALRDASPQKIKSELDRKNFTRRKLLDKLRDQNNTAEKQLAQLQLEVSNLQNGSTGKDYATKDNRETLNNQIQEFGAKVQAGRNIQALYKRINNFLRKDQRYYGAVLESLKENAKLQQSCIIRATEMGQLATEEVANMRHEYYQREHDVRLNMEMQLATLEEMEAQLTDLLEESQNLIRAESFTALGLDFSDKSLAVESELERQVSQLNGLLKRMQTAILVPEFKDIFPRMLEQLKQNEKLLEDLNANDNQLGLLLRKINHGHLILTATISQSEGDVATFVANRDRLLKILQQLQEELDNIGKEQHAVGNLIVKLKSGLGRLWDVVAAIPLSQDEGFEDYDEPGTTSVFHDAHSMLMMLKRKAEQMRGLARKKVRQEDREKALATQIRRRARLQGLEAREDKAIHHVSLHLDKDAEDSAVPSRADIKAESSKIYDLATTNPFDVGEAKNVPKKKAVKLFHKK